MRHKSAVRYSLFAFGSAVSIAVSEDGLAMSSHYHCYNLHGQRKAKREQRLVANSFTSRQTVKIAIRIAVFALGVCLLFFGLHKAHQETTVFQNNPGTPTNAYSPEIVAVAGAFITLGALAPSPAQLSRWMSRKRRKPVPHAHFRRQRKF
jgi:hypothetical protein